MSKRDQCLDAGAKECREEDPSNGFYKTCLGEVEKECNTKFPPVGKEAQQIQCLTKAKASCKEESRVKGNYFDCLKREEQTCKSKYPA